MIIIETACNPKNHSILRLMNATHSQHMPTDISVFSTAALLAGWLQSGIYFLR